MTDEYINPGDTVLGIYKDKYPDIMSWPAWARDKLISKWEESNVGRDADKIQANETLTFPSSNFPRQFGFRASIGDDKALKLKQFMEIMQINRGSRLAGENAVNSLRTVMGMSGNFTLPKSAVSATYLKHVMGIQDDEIVSKIIHMANNAGLESMEDYDQWYNQWGFDRKYYKQASEAFEKYIKGREAEVEAGRKAKKFDAWKAGEEAPLHVGTSKDQILALLKEGKIQYAEAPERLRQALNLLGVDQKSIEAALTSFLKEIEEFKPHDPAYAKDMERWVELASLSEKDQSTRTDDLLKLNAEVRSHAVNSWFMKGMSGSIDEKSRESLIGTELWTIVNQLPYKQQQLVWEFLKSQSPYPGEFQKGAFGTSGFGKDRWDAIEAGTTSIVVKDRNGEARTIDVQNFPREIIASFKMEGERKIDVDIPYDITTPDGQKARLRHLRGLLYPDYVIDDIIDFEIEKAGGTPRQ